MVDATTALKTFAQQFAGFHAAIIICGVVLGLYFAAVGTYNFATLPQQTRQGASPATPFYQLLTGAVLLSISAMVQIQTNSIIGDVEVRTALDYMAETESTSEEGKLLAQVLLGIMTLFGWTAIVRGWVIMANIGKNSMSQRGAEFWNACVFLFCGTVASNLLAFSDILANSFGSENFLRVYLGS